MNLIKISFKKLSLLAIVFAGIYVKANHEEYAVPLYEVGKDRVFSVMYKGPGGIDKINKQVLFAETNKNLSPDLNLKELSDRFGCKTKSGKAFLQFHLEKPISPFDQSGTIEHRQKLIQFLVEHQQVLEKLELLIEKAVPHEELFMKFMEGRSVDHPSENPITTFFRWKDRNQYAQSYSKMMESSYLVDGANKLVTPAFDVAQNAWNFALTDLSVAQKILLLSSGLVTNFPEFLSASLAPLVPSFLRSKESVNKDNLFFMNLYMTAVTGYSLYSHYFGALATRNALHSLYSLVEIAKEIEEVCDENHVENQFKVSSIRSADGLSLLEELNQSRYKDKDSNFIYSIGVNSFKYDVYEKDAALAPVYASIAEMDAYVALAKKMIAQQNEDNKFCFAQFLDDQKPKIQAKGFWNLLVSKGNVVTNDLEEGRNIILTGANEGGKTTTIRAILQNIVLAQTFGIAAAAEFIFTPYSMIHSYLNVSDDILSGKSRYASELAQARNILDQIEALPQGKKFFFVLDELFTGTNGEDGAEAAYRFIDNIASLSGIQFIYATHFNKLKQIGAVNPACANYKIEPPLTDEKGRFIRDDKGEFIYPYKLSPGANNVNVALERAIHAGIFKKKAQKAA